MTPSTGPLGAASVCPVEGDGALMCRAGMVVLLAPPVAADVVDRVVEASGVVPGSARIRSLAAVLLQHQVAGVVVEHQGDSCDIFAFGHVAVVTSDETLGASDYPAGLTVRRSTDSIRAVLVGGTSVPSETGWQRLTNGVIAASGAVFIQATTGPQVVEPTSVADDSAPETVPTPIIDASVPDRSDASEAAPYEVFSFDDPIDLSDRSALPTEAPAPLPVVEVAVTSGALPVAPAALPPPPMPGIPPYAQPVLVLGVMSPRGYFNHPDALYCTRTGVKMGASATKVFVRGERPPLGVFTFDDGSTLSVQWPLIVGRRPGDHERVADGSAAGYVIADPDSRISRRHLLVDLIEWEVLISDLETANGTYMRNSNGGDTRRLVTGERAVLSSGDTILIGGRSFTFHDHHVR